MLLLSCTALASQALAAPPANNNFASSEQIVGPPPVSKTGTNVEATKETNEPNHAGNVGGKSVWYHWLAPSNLQVTIDTCESDFDTLLGVYTGNSVGALTEVATNDDSCGNKSKVTFAAASGTTYRIAVDGFNNTGVVSEGNIDLDITGPPPNDLFDLPEDLSGSPVSATGTNANATKESGEPNHGPPPGNNPGGKSVWYRWTAPSSGQVVVKTCDSSFDTLLAVYTGTSFGTLAQVAANDDSCGQRSRLSFAATGGTTYRIVVDGFNPGSGAGEGNIELDIVPRPSNDNFADAQALTGLPTSSTGTNVEATKEAGEPDHAGNVGGKSVWYRWTAASSGQVVVKTCDSNFDTLLGVYTGPGVSDLNMVASNNDGCGTRSRLSFAATGGTEYFIAVDGVGAVEGTFDFDIVPLPATETFGSDLTVPAVTAFSCGSFPVNSPCTVVATGFHAANTLPTTAPFDGVIVRLRIKTAGADTATFRLARTVTAGQRTGAGTGPTVDAGAGGTHELPARMPVQAGDFLGIDGSSSSAYNCAGGSEDGYGPPLQDAGAGRSPGATGTCELLVNADVEVDADGDVYGDVTQDNCPGVSNPNQENTDGDGQGDACDGDDDADGVPDASDACPTQAAATADGCTPPPDRDGDGKPDSEDACPDQPAATADGCPAVPAVGSGVGPTNGNDVLNGDALANVICGLFGNDTINGLGGHDTLFGDACNKTSKAGTAQVTTDGNDKLSGGDGNDKLYGAGGRDTLKGGRGNDKLFGGAGNDSLSGEDGKDGLDGGAGNDKLNGGKDKNTYKGGAGNDSINARNKKKETVDCGSGKKDTATVDKNDKVRGCEKIKRAKK